MTTKKTTETAPKTITVGVTLRITVDVAAWALDNGLDNDAAKVRQDFIEHIENGYNTSDGGIEPGHIHRMWDSTVTKVTATAC